ncbi:MAG: hypothetical protein MI919_14620, partial [Holophagales bacterium]|nr:hypothetical protein [Holophagales bacterium]
MRATLTEWSFHRISELELPVCRFCHRLGTVKVQRFFSVVSKVGDGHYWYVVLGLLLLFHGQTALPLFAQVMVSGTVCHLLYKSLKHRTARPRPFAFAEGTHGESFELAVPPLDKYSFPSGHTLHAV